MMQNCLYSGKAGCDDTQIDDGYQIPGILRIMTPRAPLRLSESPVDFSDRD